MNIFISIDTYYYYYYRYCGGEMNLRSKREREQETFNKQLLNTRKKKFLFILSFFLFHQCLIKIVYFSVYLFSFPRCRSSSSSSSSKKNIWWLMIKSLYYVCMYLFLIGWRNPRKKKHNISRDCVEYDWRWKLEKF